MGVSQGLLEFQNPNTSMGDLSFKQHRMTSQAQDLEHEASGWNQKKSVMITIACKIQGTAESFCTETKQMHMSHETIGILIMVYYNPHIYDPGLRVPTPPP